MKLARQTPNRLGQNVRTGVQSGDDTKQPIVAYIFIVSLCIPVFFYLGPIRLAPFLLVLLVLFVPMFGIWLTGSRTRATLPDFLILAYCVWAGFALVKSRGINASIEPVAIVLIQTFGSYLVGRIYVSSVATFRKVINFQLLIIVFIIPFAIVETTTNVPILLKLFQPFGNVLYDAGMPPRLGLRRVQALFEHPILYGVFVSSCFAMIFFLRPLSLLHLICLGTVCVAVLVSLSTGALLSLVVQILLIIWGAAMSSQPRKWLIACALFLISYAAIDLLSNRSPFEVFVSYLTFNVGSSYNRIHIWEFGTAEVWRNPFFGIGLNDWIRPAWMHSGSMDNFWLLQAVRYGLPAFIMLTLAFVLVLFKVGNTKINSQRDANLRTGFVISIVGVFFAICSVHLWNSTFCWLMFLIGSSLSFTQIDKEKYNQDALEPDLTNKRLGYTRMSLHK